MTIEIRSEHACFGGRQGFYSHLSSETGTKMNFTVFVPAQAARAPVPALYYLAGLTCMEETFMVKAGAQRVAAELGFMLVACDTSPRGLGLPGEADAWDFGVGAGFYLDALQPPWAKNYRMGSYVNLGNYLGADRSAWAAWDASLLMRSRAHPAPILVDQGMNDQRSASTGHFNRERTDRCRRR